MVSPSPTSTLQQFADVTVVTAFCIFLRRAILTARPIPNWTKMLEMLVTGGIPFRYGKSKRNVKMRKEAGIKIRSIGSIAHGDGSLTTGEILPIPFGPC